MASPVSPSITNSFVSGIARLRDSVCSSSDDPWSLFSGITSLRDSDCTVSDDDSSSTTTTPAVTFVLCSLIDSLPISHVVKFIVGQFW